MLAFSPAATAYFAFLALDYHVYKLDSILLGVVLELLTTSPVLAVAGVFAFSVARLVKNRRLVNACNVSSALILFALNCLIWSV